MTNQEPPKEADDATGDGAQAEACQDEHDGVDLCWFCLMGEMARRAAEDRKAQQP